MKVFIGLALTSLLSVLIFTVALTGISRTEVMECISWQEDAEEFEYFFLTNWQAQQCLAHGIEVGAPVVMPCNKAQETPVECEQRLGEDWNVIYKPMTDK